MTKKPVYAGFWLRVLAFFLDSIIIYTAIGVLFVILIMMSLMDESAATLLSIFIMLVAYIGTWLYYALFESSARQATPGKMIVGLKVTDMKGKKISFGRATGRFFGKYISQIILYVGFLMIAFTEKKQGLHDIIAGCLVVQK